MQEINWKIFAAKFNGKEQSSFEWLCNLLFCDEFNKHKGMFRYKNQAGIETEPIEHDGKVIGFQAKYYETSISSNKDKIKDAIKKAKDRNPTLDKILFYINREFSESSRKEQKDPKYKIEIEEYASSVGIEIEWRSKSFFESSFVCDKNATIARHFFSPEKSTIDFMGELIWHTESALAPIHSNMQFKGTEIKIDRSQPEVKRCSFVCLSFSPYLAAVTMDNAFYRSQTDTCPWELVFSVQTLEHLEQFARAGHIKASTVVPDKECLFTIDLSNCRPSAIMGHR